MRRTRSRLVALCVLAALALGCQGPRAAHGDHGATADGPQCTSCPHGHKGGKHGNHGGHSYSDDRELVEMVSTLMGGKNVFVPSTVVFTKGEGRTLSLFNTTDIPHGFQIPALGVEAVLPSREEFVIDLPALSPGVYAIQCHLHPPHRSATLLVLP